MSNTENLQELQQSRTGPKQESKRLEEKRKSLEEKTKILEEKAHAGKLAIDKQLLVQILEEENRTHDAAVKELEDKIANLEQQLKSSPPIENAPGQVPFEPSQEISDDVDEGSSADLLPPPEQSEVEVFQEGSRRKKRNLF
jgi:vacuolar-type H+-ATPase subunit I/STV1